MLSILLPVYNFPCFELAEKLVLQASENGIPFELICINDASTQFKEENRTIRLLPYTTYIELSENIGRSRIRNLLVSKAQYEILLFLDCDSKIVGNDYIKKYLAEFHQTGILSGGTLYEPYPPIDTDYMLHWMYGSKREPKPDGNQREIFTSNNFMIGKAVIKKYPFNESIVRYGHEDTFFQIELKKHHVQIRHINNPVLHIGLETNKRFLEKTRDAMLNLYDFYKAGYFNGLDTDKIRLLKIYLSLRKYGLTTPVGWLYPVINYVNTKINTGKHPNLKILDLYKLAFLARIFQKG
jgi:glycosyltransferase involved in cell wall biosynthesis